MSLCGDKRRVFEEECEVTAEVGQTQAGRSPKTRLDLSNYMCLFSFCVFRPALILYDIRQIQPNTKR